MSTAILLCTFGSIERDGGRDVEELTVLADPKVREAVDRLVDRLFKLVVLHRPQRRVDLKGKRHRRVVQLLRADVDGARALPDLHPVLAEAGVGEDVDVAGGHGQANICCMSDCFRRLREVSFFC